ncbi:metallophosphoesterase [Archaeoglobus profundus]|uniref:Phosphoesterase n=1 Tax=Archaeoglobus profundus (strain DSM 5631 / JCM 9629 / NBRC 100127 / Av18) TaxID=572546 RepID=D2RDI4_ARCPA|nr:metallophosphoesterase [Archaeoglobus profundus]ADB58178.1 phosphoesterase [Archaeoglobus profundus DSM 5631]
MRAEVVPGEPALILRGRKRILIVADLHIGLVRYVDENIVNKLRDLANDVGADEVVILGDLKHSLGYDRRVENLLRDFDFILVKGNHDGGLEGEKELRIGKFHLIHGHFKPKDFGDFLIVGHAHPSIYLYGVKERVWIFGEWKNRKVIVMPAFNELCSSTPINLRRPAGFLFREWDYSNANVATLDCVMLGKVKDLKVQCSSTFRQLQ